MYHGKYLVIINKGKTKLEGKADLVFHDSIGKIMNQFDKEINVIRADGQFDGMDAKEIAMLDYDDQPYGDDNVLVRASKRRAFLASSSRL